MSDSAVFSRSIDPPWWALAAALFCLTASDAHSEQSEGTVRVASVQAGDDASRVDASCAKADANCAIEALVRQAHEQGAALVVTPEYALRQSHAEPAPKLGDVPADTGRSPLLSRFSAVARELGIYLALHLETKRGKRLYNSQVALGPEGEVVGVHHKFELFGSERDTHTAGDGVMAFDTPFGRVGLLVCADVYGDPRMHDELTREAGARIIALSAKWTVARATRWQAAFARDWGVFVVAANAASGAGRGGGVFDPQGQALAIDERGEGAVTVATIPIQH